ncbi:hypothetical protein GQ44DRAFT_187304 [Phaeosphaeriaceae sp. PMI808]|nr:hypothetical protein GQ44DRAFT_187304 [Phaeosphaeriaceae sp. PMI808]
MTVRFGVMSIALSLLQPVLATAQTGTGIGGTHVPSQSAPPFPIPANSSTVVIGTLSSSRALGTGTTNSLDVSVSGTFLSPSSPSSRLSTSNRLSPSGTNSDHTHTPSLSISTVRPTLSVVSSTTQSIAIPPPNAISSTSSLSTTHSVQTPSSFPEATSRTDGLRLPPGITLAPNPSTTLATTGAEIRSSASDLSIVFAGIFPFLQNWIDNPSPPKITAVTNELGNILPKAIHLLAMLPKPTNGVEPCKHRRQRRSKQEGAAVQNLNERDIVGNLFKTAFSLVTCIIDTTNKMKDTIIKGTTDAVETVKAFQNDLQPMVDALNKVGPNEEEKPKSKSKPTSTQPKSPSSSSCTLQTVRDCNIGCTARVITTIGGHNKRAEEDTCTTVCGAPITKCSAQVLHQHRLHIKFARRTAQGAIPTIVNYRPMLLI